MHRNIIRFFFAGREMRSKTEREMIGETKKDCDRRFRKEILGVRKKIQKHKDRLGKQNVSSAY